MANASHVREATLPILEELLVEITEECAFGRRYRGEGSRQLGHLPAWRAIAEPHCLVHDAAAALVREARASLELLRCFVELKKECQASMEMSGKTRL